MWPNPEFPVDLLKKSLISLENPVAVVITDSLWFLSPE